MRRLMMTIGYDDNDKHQATPPHITLHNATHSRKRHHSIICISWSRTYIRAHIHTHIHTYIHTHTLSLTHTITHTQEEFISPTCAPGSPRSLGRSIRSVPLLTSLLLFRNNLLFLYFALLYFTWFHHNLLTSHFITSIIHFTKRLGNNTMRNRSSETY